MEQSHLQSFQQEQLWSKLIYKLWAQGKASKWSRDKSTLRHSLCFLARQLTFPLMRQLVQEYLPQLPVSRRKVFRVRPLPSNQDPFHYIRTPTIESGHCPPYHNCLHFFTHNTTSIPFFSVFEVTPSSALGLILALYSWVILRRIGVYMGYWGSIWISHMQG